MSRLLMTPLAVALVGLLACPGVGRADNIDRVMREDGADLAAAVRSKLQTKVVAVLKFQTQIGTAKPSFTTGTENQKMAERVQNLLVVTNDDANPLTVLANAGEAAAAKARHDKHPLDWTTEAGRKTLFELSLPVLWNPAEKKTPDAYVTGIVHVSADMKGATVELVGFTRAAPGKLVKLGTIKKEMAAGKAVPIPVDRATLADLGQSFALSKRVLSRASVNKGLTSRKLIDDEASASAAGTSPDKPGTDVAPIAPAESPVLLEILYDGQPQAPTADPDSAREEMVATPADTQKFTFRVTNTLDYPVGILLTVNGKNTIAIDGEDLATAGDPSGFRLWVLKPGKKYDITGFLKSETGTSAPFKVLPEDESARLFDTLAPTYAGRIQMNVYGKLPPAITPGSLPKDPSKNPGGDEPVISIDTLSEDSLASASLGTSLEKVVAKAKTPGQAKLIAKGTLNLTTDSKGHLKSTDKAKSLAKGLISKGLVVESEQRSEAGKVEIVPLQADPEPIASRTIRYYTKGTVVPIAAP